MLRTIERALVCAGLTLAALGHATPAEDFVRGAKVELINSSADLHINAGILYDERSAVMQSPAAVCIDKLAASSQVDIPFSGFGIPVTVRFTATPIDATHLRLTANQDINQCVTLRGADRRIKHVTAVLTATLDPFRVPTAGTCAPDFGQNLTIRGGAEGDADNYLHFDVDSGCSGLTVGAGVDVYNVTIDALAGALPPAMPLTVASFTADRTLVCPSPSRPLTVRGALQLRYPAPYAGATFAISTSDSTLVPSSPTLTIPPVEQRGSTSVVVPAGYVGSFHFDATSAGVTTSSNDVLVVNGLPVFGGKCRMPSLAKERRDLLGVCLACDFRGRIRQRTAAARVAQSAKGSAYLSAASLAGTAGASTLDGPLTGLLNVFGKSMSVAGVSFTDLSDHGVAIGTAIDPQTQTHSPVLWNGALKYLPSPSGWGEAHVVNESGAVGGWVLDLKNVQQAALWDSGTLSSLHPQGMLQSEVVALGDDGLATVQAWDTKGFPRGFLFDSWKKSMTAYPVPQGYDGVELVGATREGLVAGHLLRKGVRSAFIDFGAGVQLLDGLAKGFTIVRLISLDADGLLLAEVSEASGKTITFVEIQ